jgi:hypothetical protein
MNLLRQEIAQTAARLIAEDGLDYGQAKRKAVRQLLGDSRPPRGDWLPDNDEIEAEVRDYQALFMADTQPARLRHLRLVAASLMRRLQPWPLYLAGAAWNGTAGQHSQIHLQLFSDVAKDFGIHLLNLGIAFEVGEVPDFRGNGRQVEALAFEWQREGVIVSCLPEMALRGALRDGERGDLAALEQLLAKES